jgi:hypothetical protein
MAEAQDELLVQRVVGDLCRAIESASPLAAAAD